MSEPGLGEGKALAQSCRDGKPRVQGGEVEMGTKPASAQPTALAPGLCLRTETQEEVLTQRWLFRGLSVTPTLARPLSYL